MYINVINGNQYNQNILFIKKLFRDCYCKYYDTYSAKILRMFINLIQLYNSTILYNLQLSVILYKIILRTML